MSDNYLYLDTETTGLNPVINDIIELGAIIEVKGERKEEFKAVCRPFNMKSISRKALETNQHTMDMIETYPDPKEVFKKFILFLGKYFNGKDFNNRYVLVGQNVDFDKRFLKAFFHKCGYDEYAFNKVIHYQSIDLLGLSFLLRAKGLIPNGKLKLEVMTKLYGIKQAKEHDALEDIRSTYDILKKIEKLFIRNPEEIDLSLLDDQTPLYAHLLNISQSKS